VPPRWLVRALDEVRRCGLNRSVDFTVKADEELLALGLALTLDDACDILAHLSVRDFVERTISARTGEAMYVFTPQVADVSLYLKVILRRRCVVISFHEQDQADDHEDG
jgi:hypothetical protein